MLPTVSCVHLPFPGRPQFWNFGHDRCVLDCVGEHTPLRESPEAVIVLSPCGHVFRIECKVGIRRSVLSDPFEGLKPLIGRCSFRPLDVFCSGEQPSLGNEHSTVDQKQEHCPAPDSLMKNMFAEIGSADQGEEDVNQMKIA